MQFYIEQHHTQIQCAPYTTSNTHTQFEPPHAHTRNIPLRVIRSFAQLSSAQTIHIKSILNSLLQLTEIAEFLSSSPPSIFKKHHELSGEYFRLTPFERMFSADPLMNTVKLTRRFTAQALSTQSSPQFTFTEPNEEQHHLKVPIFAQLTAESYVGFLHGTAGALPSEEAAYLATARIHNRWLYLLFDHLARQAPRSSEHQALLIALGLAQYQTTGMWPWGAWWHQTFAGEAPAHWLPAAMWHMCFAVGEPDNPAHEAAVDAAFAHGADPNNPEAWPELAEALRQHRLHATPPEVLALYDHGDATGDEASGDT